MSENKYELTAIRMFYQEHRSLKRLFPATRYMEWDQIHPGCRKAWLRAARERFI